MKNKTKTQSVINKIQDRVAREFGQLKEVENTLNTALMYLEGPSKDLPGAVRALDELKRVLGEVSNEVQAARGNLQEGQDLIADLVDGQANTATLVKSIQVFMQGNYSILLQAFNELDDPLRIEAMRQLPQPMRRRLLNELMQIEHEQ